MPTPKAVDANASTSSSKRMAFKPVPPKDAAADTDPPKKKADKKKADPKKAVQAEAQPDPFTQLAQSLVGELQQEQAPIEAAISGSLAGPAAATAMGIADQAAGVSPNSAAGQWMQKEANAGAQQSDPLSAALAAYGTAYGASQVGVDQAIINMGKANDAAVNDSGADAFLNAISSHLLSTDSGYYSLPAGQQKNLPPAVAQALQQAGIQGITTPKGGWGPGSLPAASNTNALTGLTGLSPAPTSPEGTTLSGSTNPSTPN